MTQTVNRLKTNRVLAGKPCGWCSNPLTFGEDAALCEGCTTGHHAACWDGKGGCASDGCVNAPLKQLAPQPERPAGPPPGKMNCPNCQLQILASSVRCEYCNVGVTSPDGVYRGPTQTAPGAVASLVFGILAFFLCGIIFGLVAIQKADEAKTAIASDPSLTGGGIATTGKVLGIIALVVWGLGLIMQPCEPLENAMGARVKDLGLGVVAAGWLVAATWMTPAGDVLAAPSGETLPTMCWIRATTGHECPTCGMSRSFVAFFHGDLGHAFQFHPLGPLLAAASVMVLVSVLGLAISGRRPLWGRPVFARSLTLAAAGALFAGVVRMLVGGLG